MTKHTFCIVLLLSFFLTTGCARNPFGAVHVTGTVTLDDTPVEGVNVSFFPTGESGLRDCYGLTDAEGKFVLTIPGDEFGSGAQPGEYVVTFSKTKDPMEGITLPEGLSGDDIAKELARRFPRGLPGPIELLPAKYGNRRSTPVAPVTVAKGEENDFTFTLTSGQ